MVTLVGGEVEEMNATKVRATPAVSVGRFGLIKSGHTGEYLRRCLWGSRKMNATKVRATPAVSAGRFGLIAYGHTGEYLRRDLWWSRKSEGNKS